MPNKDQARTDDSGVWNDMKYGTAEWQRKSDAAKRSGRRIVSDDTREGFTCLRCLDGDHERCYNWEGQHHCPCSICRKTHAKAAMVERRAARQAARTRPRKVRQPRSQAARADLPTAKSADDDAELIVAMVEKLALGVLNEVLGVTDTGQIVTVS